jgi:ABC-type multidrug transport system permease subunit
MTAASPKHPAVRYSPLFQLVVARVKEFVRQPEAMFWSYGFPVLMVLTLGIAFRNKPATSIMVDVVAGPSATVAREKLEDSGGFIVHINEPEVARLRLRTARTDIIAQAHPPTGSSTQPSYLYWFDPTRPESALARLRVDDAVQRASGRNDVAQTSDVPVQEPGSRYVDFLVPGLMGMNVMAGGLWGVGFAIVYMRIRKLLKRLVATPMKKRDFLLGVIISRLVFTIPGVLVILYFSWMVFDVRIQGRIFDLVVLIFVGAFTFSGIGLLIASRADTIETVSGLMNLVMLPMWVFSGVFFSSERFPAMLQPMIQALPLTPLIDGLRATMLEGHSLTSPAQLVRLAWLAGWGLVTFVLALRWFRWS